MHPKLNLLHNFLLLQRQHRSNAFPKGIHSSSQIVIGDVQWRHDLNHAIVSAYSLYNKSTLIASLLYLCGNIRFEFEEIQPQIRPIPRISILGYRFNISSLHIFFNMISFAYTCSSRDTCSLYSSAALAAIKANWFPRKVSLQQGHRQSIPANGFRENDQIR